MADLKIYPSPAHLTVGDRKHKVSINGAFFLKGLEDFKGKDVILHRLQKVMQTKNEEGIEFHLIQQKSLGEEAYILQWKEKTISIRYQTDKGLFYALTTFAQMIDRNGPYLYEFYIEDEPDYPVRGYMLDIGRNKIPTVETLYQMIEDASQMKINHLQFHMEGFVFDYEKYRHLFPEATPLTSEEIKSLVAYADQRFIDLVPNQNCFGHMGPWLAKDELNYLAEHPQGIDTPFDFKVPPITLNPIKKESMTLVENLFHELIPHYGSDYVNINLDEPFGLGKGASAAVAKEVGIGNLYMDFAEQIFQVVRQWDKEILMWGDVLKTHPDIIKRIPKDVTILQWNYDGDASFTEDAKMLRDHEVNYYLCAGTSSWNALTGRTENMVKNINDAAQTGMAYGASGLLVTDWGDNGHLQSLPMTYPGLTYFAGVSWQVENNINQIENTQAFISESLFKDDHHVIGKLLFDLGAYEKYENSSIENGSLISQFITQGYVSTETFLEKMEMMLQLFLAIGGKSQRLEIDFQREKMEKWMERVKEDMKRIKLEPATHQLVLSELRNSLAMVELGKNMYIYLFEKENIPNKYQFLLALEDALADIEKNFTTIWLRRNKAGGLEASLAVFEKIKENLHKEKQKLKSDKQN